MNRHLFHLLALLLFCLSVAECKGNKWSNYNQGTSRQTGRGPGPYASTYPNGSAEPAPEAAAKVSPQKSYRGIGAWGYVAILLTVILSGLGVYYFILFYPIVCKKERMYDVMEMTTV